MPGQPHGRSHPRPAHTCWHGRRGGAGIGGERDLEEGNGGHDEHLGARPIRQARWWPKNLTRENS
jgi:hypothetical protein